MHRGSRKRPRSTGAVASTSASFGAAPPAGRSPPLGYVIPFTITGVVLLLVEPLTAPVALMAFAQGWILPELYAQRGANVIRPKGRAAEGPERVALGLLGDLIGHDARELHSATGLVMERGRLGVWLLGEGGALLVCGGRDGARRVHCYCVRVTTRTCRRAIASPTCCWRSARTRPALRPWRTTPSAVPAGACVAGSPSPCGRRSTRRPAGRAIRPTGEHRRPHPGPSDHGRGRARRGTMTFMPNHPRTGSPIGRLSLLAVADTKHRAPGAPKVRRYRLARCAETPGAELRPVAHKAHGSRGVRPLRLRMRPGRGPTPVGCTLVPCANQPVQWASERSRSSCSRSPRGSC